MLTLRQSTASQIVQIGPFISDTDFKTAQTGLTIANTDIKLNKHSTNSQASKNSGGATAIANGYYYTTLDATDTATAGRLVLSVNVATALPVWHEFLVQTAPVFDALTVGSANVQADISSPYKKNTASSNFEFPMTLTGTRTPATGKTVTATRSIDGGAFASCTNSVTEVASGMYKINLSAADLNGNWITLKFSEGACNDTLITIGTQP